jgi:hypothetical protein
MAKINRYKLSHGTKLTNDHLNSSLGAATDVLNSGLIQKDQITPNKNAFYINWNIPVIRSSWGEAAYKNKIEVPIPFILPPTQELFDSKYHSKEQLITLDEIMFSFDQNGNPLAFTDTYDASEYPALLYDGVADAYKVRIRLYEKTPSIISSDVQITPENLIYQLDIESSAFLSTKHRNNPLIQSDLNISINPYKTYIMTISFPNGLEHDYTQAAVTKTRTAMLPSTNVRAKFRSKLLESDVASGLSVQNIPTVHQGQNSFPPSVVTPVFNAGDGIYAEEQGGTYGIQSSMQRLDYYTNKGYNGGLTTKSDITPNGSIKSMYGYDVICVPLFQATEAIRRGQLSGSYRKDILPYVDHYVDQPQYTIDRRMIHISYPFTIHHVFCAVSFYANKTSMQLCGDTATSISNQNADIYAGVYRAGNLTREVGVLIGNGIRSEDYAMQQVAYCQMDNAYAQYRVDTVQLVGINGDEDCWGSVDTNFNRSYVSADTELWQVPLNYGSSRTGYGFSQNGTPTFIGEGNLRTKARSNIYAGPFDWVGANTAVTPKTNGAEQFIEVRGKISDTTHWLGYNTTEAQKQDIIIGYVKGNIITEDLYEYMDESDIYIDSVKINIENQKKGLCKMMVKLFILCVNNSKNKYLQGFVKTCSKHGYGVDIKYFRSNFEICLDLFAFFKFRFI